MSKYEIIYRKAYRKQYRALKRRGYNMSLIDDVVLTLANGETLPPNYKDHPMKGDKRGYRNCHIKDDWVLLYKIERGKLLLILSETGTHSDILE